MAVSTRTLRFDRAFLILLADWLAVGVAVALPWSTSAASVSSHFGLWLRLRPWTRPRSGAS